MKLLDHPPELLSLIVARLEPSDICNIRLTCHALDDFTFDIFSALFEEILLLPTKENFTRLRQLSRHARLASSVTYVRIVTSLCMSSENDGAERIVPRGELPFMAPSTEYERCANEYASLVNQKDYIKSALVLALYKLKRRIVVSVYERTPEYLTTARPWGWRALHKRVNQNPSPQLSYTAKAGWDYHQPNVHTMICSESLEACGFAGVASVSVESVQQDYLEAIQRPLQQMGRLYIDLRNLCITTSDRKLHVSQRTIKPGLHLSNFLSSLPNLLSLHLDLSSDDNNDGYHHRVSNQIFKNVKFTNLETLLMRAIRMEPEVLMLFISNSKASLTDLFLWRVSFPRTSRPSSWLSILKHLRAHFALECVDIRMMITALEEYEPKVDDIKNTKSGKTMVMEALDRCIQKLEDQQ